MAQHITRTSVSVKNGSITPYCIKAVLPVFGMIFEQAAIATGFLEATRFRIETLGLALVVIIGTLLIVITRAKDEQKR